MKIALLCLSLAFAMPLMAAHSGPFDPVPGNQKDLYRFDLKDNFYSGEAAWKADMARARDMISAVESHRGKVLESPSALLDVLNGVRDLDDLMVRLFAYGEFREAVNTGDRTAYEAYEKLDADMQANLSFIQVELKDLSQEKMDAFIKAEPALAPYRYYLEDTVRMGPHTLSEARESVLAKFGPDLTSWQPVLFQKTFDRTDFPKIEVDGKSFDVHIDYDTLIRNPDRKVREEAFKDYYHAFEKISDLVGFALYREMRTYNDEARMRGFKTYYNETLFQRYLTRPQVDNLYAQIEAHLPLYHAYQRFRMKQVEDQLGVEQSEIWDMEIPPRGAPEPRFTADQGVKVVEDSLKVLGPEYSTDLDNLLNPKNGRIDIVGGPNRGQGAFTEGFYGFFMDNYQGYLTNVSTIAHEAGHAVHYRLVVDNRKHILFADGPSYMTESFAMFNEWLVRDHLLKTEKDPAVVRTIKQDTVNEMMYLWELARRAKFEMVSYDRVASGEITGDEGFDKACEDTGRLYDLWFQKYPELKVHWIRKHHYWTVPTYYVNYVLAQVLAMKYYEMYLQDPGGFPKKYVAMVRNGFDRPAADLLKDFLGVDLGDPKLLDGTFNLIQRDFDQLKAAGKAAS